MEMFYLYYSPEDSFYFKMHSWKDDFPSCLALVLRLDIDIPNYISRMQRRMEARKRKEKKVLFPELNTSSKVFCFQ